ncbi:putative HTH-type transcriptional regulator MsmR [Halobacillus andaensis]|uniref:HTH-type transcriptional regulator MsmR n=1 Tax=Halobacillus andaensis TaxID=1176239 RepID=A0A917EY91_HALAA|nr:LacI family DNA-binding transcriptional regulator [Halobacillus andaensis]MBP2005253.1 LacI family transcriptional regulator [Halobacillus andaensis]GGF30022.1 putative HTH-type transcriptional regulator MsmR [Halobacillus andaensis]
MASLKDVAKAANVSIATVSRVLSEDETLSVADTTRKRVYESAKKLNYLSLSNKKKASLLNKKKSIGLIIFCSKDYEYEDEYFISIRRGIEAECLRFNLNISSVVRQEKNWTEDTSLNDLHGVIVVGNISPETVQQIYAKYNRVVFVDESPGTEKFDSVTSDFYSATIRLMEHLISLGHKNIGFIGGQEIIHSSYQEPELDSIDNLEKLRFVPYKKIMERRGYYNDQHVYIGDWSTDAGYHLMNQAISKGQLPTAFITASDPLAIGALRALHDSGFHVPNDVSIVSYNDVELASYLNPPLTTAKVFSEEMGKSAVKLLNERMEGRDIPTKIVHPCKVQFRESSSVNNQDNCSVTV